MKLPKNLPLLLLVAALSACGGVPVEARIAVEETAHGINAVDTSLSIAVRERGEVLAEVLREMVADGRVTSHESGMAWYRVRMAPHAEAVAALEVAADSLRAVEAGLDAWDAGASGDGFLAAAACSGAAVLRLLEALARVDIEIPPELSQWLGFLDGVVTTICPEPAE